MDAQTLSEYADYIRWLSNGGDGAGGIATCTLAAEGDVRSFTIHTPGSGYNEGDVLTCNDATFSVTAVSDENGGVISAELVFGGSTIVDASNVATTVSPAGGTGCTLNLVAQFPIYSVTIVDPGTNYITARAHVSGGDGSDEGVIVFEINGNAELAGYNVIDSGSYRTTPTLQVIPTGPETGDAFFTALTAYDNTHRDKRFLDILGYTERTVTLNAASSGAFESMRQSIIDRLLDLDSD
jgi:hypothetical protein